jgi:PAS domain S-box-containing protein
MELNEIIHALPALLGTVVAIALVVLLVVYQIKKWSVKSQPLTTPAVLQPGIGNPKTSEPADTSLLKATSDFYYSTLIDTMSEGLLYVNNDDYLQFANQRFYNLVGYTEAELKGEPLMNIIVPEEYHEIVKQKNSLRKQKVNDWYEIPFRHKSGKLIWVKISGAYLQNSNGEVVGSLGTITDISSLKNTYDQLKESEERFVSFMNNLPAAAWIKDNKGKLLFINKNYAYQFGLSPEEVIGKTVQELLPEHAISASLERDREVIKTGKKDELIEHTATPNGEGHYWMVSRFALPVVNKKQNQLGGIAFNITTLIETQNQLEKSLREKEVLLREIHHRVKNNLQIISSLLNLQNKSVADESSAKALIESQNRVRSMALIHEKLYQSANLDLIDFGDYAKSICHHLYKSYVVDSSKIKLHLEADNIRINVETAMPMGLILTELFSNALKYAFRERESGNVNISLRFDGDWLVMIVADDGTGMPADFDIRTSGSLGLQLVETLIEQVHGQLEFDTKNGTRFIVVVPVNIPAS